jgi:hypothetical protein
MANLSLTQAWNETAAFVKREARLLFPVALLLSVLPMALVGLLAPRDTAPNAIPEPGLWLAAVPVALVIGMVGNLAISTLALRPGLTVADALRNGLRRMPSLLGATLLLCLAASLVLIVLAVIAALLFVGPISNPAPEALFPVVVTVFLLMIPFILYFGARLLVTTPVAAAEGGGPLAIIRRSWQLSRESVWTLVGFILLLVLLLLVVSIAVGAVLGILIFVAAGPPEAGSLSAILLLIVRAVLDTVVTVYMTVMIARIYAQLSGSGTPDVFA